MILNGKNRWWLCAMLLKGAWPPLPPYGEMEMENFNGCERRSLTTDRVRIADPCMHGTSTSFSFKIIYPLSASPVQHEFLCSSESSPWRRRMRRVFSLNSMHLVLSLPHNSTRMAPFGAAVPLPLLGCRSL